METKDALYLYHAGRHVGYVEAKVIKSRGQELNGKQLRIIHDYRGPEQSTDMRARNYQNAGTATAEVIG